MAFAIRAALGLAMLFVGLSACRGVGAPNEPVQNLVVRSWGTEAGLPQNTVNSIVQTQDGYLWLATRDGLARFDGVRFTVFGLQEGLSSVDVSTVYEDRSRRLWVGTVGGGLSRLVDGRFERIRGAQGETVGDTITTFAEDRRGRLWIGTIGGVRLWEAGKFVEDDGLKEVARTAIRRLLLDRQGRMWIATVREGLFLYDHGKLTPQPGPAANPQVNAYCLLEDRLGQLWAGVGNWMVLCLDRSGWRVYNQTNGVPFAFVTSLAQDAEGTVWAGSLDEGLYRLDQDHFQPLRKANGLSADDIRCLHTDQEGNLWVGTRTGGLNRLSRRKLLHYGVTQGLTNDFTRAVAESADGTLWVATTGGGLYRGGAQGFQAFVPNQLARFYAHPESVLVTEDGSLWWGGAHALLCWQAGQLTGCYTNQPWLHNGTVTALCDAHQGALWIGTSEGTLVRADRGSFAVFPYRVARGPVVALAQETNGFLWVGSPGGGLKRLRWGSDDIFSVTNGLLSQSIRTLYLDKENTLWIGTAGGGLSRRRRGRIASFTSQQGLGANTVSQIVDDEAGNLWLGCNRGIIRVRKSELEDLAEGRTSFLHPRVYGVNDGMPVEECSSGSAPACLKTSSGLICFCTVKGLVLLDPKQSEADAPPPRVLLEEALVNAKPVALGRLPPPASGATAETPELGLTIVPGGREVELHYTGIDFASPEKVNFRYQLEGVDRGWVEAGRRRVAYYHRLPPGTFDFHVTACGANGQWNEAGAALRLTVRPYFWETTWFRVGAALALAGALAGTFRLVERRKYKRRLKALETQHAVERERLRISQDMHDHVGGMLTQVSQLSDLGQSAAGDPPAARGHFERIGVQARSAVQALDEIVWATNPKNDNLPRFADYVCRFADEFFENSAVRCWQEVPTTLPNLLLPSDVRHNVFLATKEAFHNVLKHSGAREVWLRLALEESQVRLEIEDNGRGFELAKPRPGGNGLENMKARLAECGGRAEFTSSPGKGSRIRFVFPLSAK